MTRRARRVSDHRSMQGGSQHDARAQQRKRLNVKKCLVFAHNTQIIQHTGKRYMLVWEDNVSNRTTPTIRTAQEPSLEARAMVSSPLPFQPKPALQALTAAVTKASAPDQADSDRAPRQCGRQAHHQRPDRRQPVGAVQVQVGLGEVPRHVRQPLDAARGQHVARHRDMEGSEWPDRRRAPSDQAQSRLLRHRRFAGRQQHRARHLPPHHGARVPPVPAAPGLRRGDPHPRLSVHRRVARAG